MQMRKYIFEEITQTKRAGIVHLENMKPLEFLDLLQDIIKSNGKLKDVKVTLKVDGAGIRFGKDEKGKFFFETSRSGPIQQKNAFSAYAIQKGLDTTSIARARHYDEIYDHLEHSTLWKDLPNDTKVIAEVLYNPMAEIIGDKLKFVTIPYDKDKLGNIMTVVLLDVVVASTGVAHEKKDAILSGLLKKSNADIKIVDPVIKNKMTFDVQAIVKPASILGDFKEIKSILSSKKRADQEKKQFFAYVLQQIKDQLSAHIINNPNMSKDILGQDFEGIVLTIGGRLYKITSEKYRKWKFVEMVEQK